MTDTERRMRNYITQLVMERENMRKIIRELETAKLRLEATLARAAVKDSLRGMEDM